MPNEQVELPKGEVSRRSLVRGWTGGVIGLGIGGSTLTGGVLGSGTALAAPARTESGRTSDPRRWLAALPDSLSLDDLTMPGAHNACATVGGPFDTAKCQELSLPELLDAGVRYLDIRCRPVDGSFAIHHGSVYQQKNFRDVLEECRTFLTDNPGETLLMSVQKEHSDAPVEEFARIFHELYLEELGFGPWFHRDSDRLPMLGEVRQKIVLIAKEPGIGGLDRYDTRLLSVQDDWELPVSDKWARVVQHLDDADTEAPDTTRLAVNYLSTTAGELIPLPRRYAEELNPRLSSRLSEEYARGERPVYGALLLDFAGTVSSELPTEIYRLNDPPA